MYEKGEQEFFFMTMFTENSISLQSCNDPEYNRVLNNYRNNLNSIMDQNLTNHLGIEDKQDITVLQNIVKENNMLNTHLPNMIFNNIECKITDRLDGNCICQDYKNFYTVGEEEMIFVFDYKYVTSFQKGGNFADHYSRSVLTNVYDYDNNLVKQFDHNQNIKFSVKDWINMAKINLNDYNLATKLSDSGDHIYDLNHPRFRLTGIEIILKISCNNLIKDTNEDYGITICDIYPQVNEGWASKGSSIFYLDYPNVNEEFISSVFKDRYRYGIKFKFYITGKIGKYSFNNMMDAIISGLVLFGTGSTIIILIITNLCCSYTKKITDESSESSHKIKLTSCKIRS